MTHSPTIADDEASGPRSGTCHPRGIPLAPRGMTVRHLAGANQRNWAKFTTSIAFRHLTSLPVASRTLPWTSAAPRSATPEASGPGLVRVVAEPSTKTSSACQRRHSRCTPKKRPDRLQLPSLLHAGPCPS